MSSELEEVIRKGPDNDGPLRAEGETGGGNNQLLKKSPAPFVGGYMFRAANPMRRVDARVMTPRPGLTVIYALYALKSASGASVHSITLSQSVQLTRALSLRVITGNGAAAGGVLSQPWLATIGRGAVGAWRRPTRPSSRVHWFWVDEDYCRRKLSRAHDKAHDGLVGVWMVRKAGEHMNGEWSTDEQTFLLLSFVRTAWQG